MTQPTQRLDLSLTANSSSPKWDSLFPAGNRSSGTLIGSANFTDGVLPPSSTYPGTVWSVYDNGSAVLSIDTVGGNSIKGICPASDGSTHVNVLGFGVPAETSSVYIQFRAKFRGTPHAIKFCKVHGKTAADFPGGSAEIPVPQQYANCTFGLGGGGSMLHTSFGDGSTAGNDTANVIDLTGASHQLGRGAGLATVLTPQNSVFSGAMWGDDVWHTFKIHVKFNSGNSALNEVNDGEFYVEIDNNVYVNATGVFNRHWANMPIDYISFFDVAQDNDYGYELLYDDIKISIGGFV